MPSSLRDVPGIGPKTEEFLFKNGITSVEQLVSQGEETLLSAPGMNAGRVATIIEGANNLIGESTVESSHISTREQNIPEAADTDRAKHSKLLIATDEVLHEMRYGSTNNRSSKNKDKKIAAGEDGITWTLFITVILIGMFAGTYSDPWEPVTFVTIWIVPVILATIIILFTHDYDFVKLIFIFFIGLSFYQGISGDSSWRNRPLSYLTTEAYYSIAVTINPPKQPENIQKEFVREILDDI